MGSVLVRGLNNCSGVWGPTGAHRASYLAAGTGIWVLTLLYGRHVKCFMKIIRARVHGSQSLEPQSSPRLWSPETFCRLPKVTITLILVEAIPALSTVLTLIFIVIDWDMTVQLRQTLVSLPHTCQ